MQNGNEQSASPAQPAPTRGPGVIPIGRAAALRFQRPLVYVRFTPEQFILSVAGSQESYRTTPHIAVHRQTNIAKEDRTGRAAVRQRHRP